jgi:hypothetical protein
VDALNQRARAVSDADDGNADGVSGVHAETCGASLMG